MAYTSQHLGYFDETKIEMLRLVLRLDLESIVCPLFHSTGLYRMFKTIIEYSGPCRDQFKRCIPTQLTQRVEQCLDPFSQLINYPDDSNVTSASSYSFTYLPSFKSLHTISRCIIDTGASVSATSEVHKLSDVRPCSNMTAYPAFGPSIHPTKRGSYGPLELDTLFIDGMPDTLLSVSQICNGENLTLQT